MNDAFHNEAGRPPAVPSIDLLPFRPFALMAVAVTGVAGCAALGALTNAVNGFVSPDYFRSVLGLSQLSDIEMWRASIARGILEGVLFGLVLSALYTAVVGISSGARCPYLFAAAHLAGMLAAALACWVVGGALALGLLALSPEYFRQTYYPDYGPIAPYFWVGGSIWGVEYGGIFCLVVGAVLFLARWRRIVRLQQATAYSRRMPPESTNPPFIPAGGLPSEDIRR